MRGLVASLMAGCLGLIATSANAVTISWTDWTSAAPSTVSGTMTVGVTPVSVAFSGSYSFAQTAGGTNYWSPSAPYDSSALVDNAPPASDIIALNTGGTATITFGQAILDPLIALVSWNGNVVDFGVPMTTISSGTGFWGGGSFGSVTATGFTGVGELHGVVQLPGIHSSITFTHTSENWHGLTVGVVALAPPPVPEPAMLGLLGFGLAGIGFLRRRQG